ncbi:hypothetical protein [Knoellia sp. Soil729]|uniref:hypothetical protein n=1 Tax=Knoellia sp. Soil729 TaxID=1736394 RepID=UPI0006F79DED|nr:hypothetical protein [Knoellia sp. Soil729]KRE43685.1 hypothetical protein ASG74_02255 [Knoellia sp. Soil729]
MRSRWDWIVLGGWVTALVVFRAARMTERDPYWQARDGIERLSGTSLIRADSWSWGPADGIFRPTSPLWNTMLGLGHESLGLAGIALVGALGMLGYFVVAAITARRLGARPLPTLAATVLVAVLALPMVSPRATIVVQTLLLATLALGHALATRPLPRRWSTYAAVTFAAAVLGMLGAWLHVSWAVTALGLAGALPLLALLAGAARWRTALAAIVGVALAVGSLLGPYGWSVWRLLLDVSSASDGQIIEWLSPFTAGLRSRWLPVVLVLLMLAVVSTVRLARYRDGTPGSRERSRWALEVVLTAIGLVSAVAGLVAIRFLGVAALTLLPVFASRLSAATPGWRANPARSEALRARLRAAYWRPIVTAVAVLLLPIALLRSVDPGTPLAEAEIAPSLPRDCLLFTDPDTAGAMLLLRPDVKVWIDMRTEVHGSQAYADTRRRLTNLRAVPLPRGTTCALLPASVASAHIDGDPAAAWSRLTAASGLSLWVPA